MSISTMTLTPAMIATILSRYPNQKGERIILDPRGIHHTNVGASGNFAQEVRIHRDHSNLDVAESLYIVDKLRDMRVVDRHTYVGAQGAVVQAFQGTRDGHKGCHTMPCQLILGARFPFQLLQNNLFLQRTIQVFARCTWSSESINAMDQILDWSEASDFVEMYKGAVREVLRGQDPTEAYGDFAGKRAEVMNQLVKQVNGAPLTNYEAVMLLGALSVEPGGEIPMSPREVEHRLADRREMEGLNQERVAIIEGYAESDRIIPNAVRSGELEHTVQSEDWTSGQQQSSAGSAGSGA